MNVPLLAQLVDLLPSGIPGVLIFYGPAIVGLAWLVSTFIRRGVRVVDFLLLAAHWALILAFYVPVHVAEYKVLQEERARQQEWRNK